MAEVFGNIGDQPVELNNAASETTLAALLEVAKAQFNSQTKGKDRKAQKDLEKKLKELAAAAARSSTEIKKVDTARKNSIRAIREETEAREEAASKTKKFGKGAVNAANGLADMAIKISRMGDSVTAATLMLTSMVKQIPLVGGAIGGLVDNVAQAIEGTQKSFMTASSVGANFSASINVMIKSASAAGLTIDQFTSLIAKNGESLAMLGTSTADGAKRFSDLSKTIRNSRLQNELANLGFNTQEINDGMASYVGLLGRTNRLTGMSNQQLIEHTGDYLKNLDAISKITGENRKAIEDRMAAEKNDAQIMVMMRKLGVDSQQELRSAMALLPEEHKRGFKDILATGTATTEEAKRLFNFMPELAQGAQKMNRDIMTSSSLAAGSSAELYNQYQKEATALANSSMGDQLSKFFPDFNGFMSSIYQVAAREGKTFEQAMAEVQASANKTSTEFGEMDPAQLVKTQQKIAESSNEMQRSFLRASGTLLKVLEKFQNGIQYAVEKLDDLSDWVENAWKKIKEWIEIFDKEGIGGIFGKIADSIFDGMKRGVGELINRAIELGEKIGTGFVGILPDWLKELAGVEGPSAAEKEKKKLQSTLEKLQNDPTVSSERIERVQNRIDYLDKIIAKENESTSSTSNQHSGDVPPTHIKKTQKATEDNTKAVTAAAISTQEQADINADWAKAGLEDEAKREKARAEREDKNTQATVDNTNATKNNTKETKAASSCDLDYSSPQALFNSFAKIMVGGKAGVTDSISGASATQRPPSHIGFGSSGNYANVSKDVDGLKDLIYRAEGTTDERAKQHGFKSGYDISYGYGKYAKSDKPISEMTIAEVKEFQKQQIAATKGKIPGTNLGTGAVGKPQVTQGTLLAMQKKIGFKDTDVFGPELQEKIMNQLLTDSGLGQFKSGKIDAKQFQNKLAGTWASIGRSDTGQSQYGQSTSGMTAVLPKLLAEIKDPNFSATPSASQTNETLSDKAETANNTSQNQPGAGAPNAGNASDSSMSSHYEMLNTQVGQLVTITRESVEIAKRQLTAVKNQSTDTFA